MNIKRLIKKLLMIKEIECILCHTEAWYILRRPRYCAFCARPVSDKVEVKLPLSPIIPAITLEEEKTIVRGEKNVE